MRIANWFAEHAKCQARIFQKIEYHYLPHISVTYDRGKWWKRLSNGCSIWIFASLTRSTKIACRGWGDGNKWMLMREDPEC